MTYEESETPANDERPGSNPVDTVRKSPASAAAEAAAKAIARQQEAPAGALEGKETDVPGSDCGNPQKDDIDSDTPIASSETSTPVDTDLELEPEAEIPQPQPGVYTDRDSIESAPREGNSPSNDPLEGDVAITDVSDMESCLNNLLYRFFLLRKADREVDARNRGAPEMPDTFATTEEIHAFHESREGHRRELDKAEEDREQKRLDYLAAAAFCDFIPPGSSVLHRKNERASQVSIIREGNEQIDDEKTIRALRERIPASLIPEGRKSPLVPKLNVEITEETERKARERPKGMLARRGEEMQEEQVHSISEARSKGLPIRAGVDHASGRTRVLGEADADPGAENPEQPTSDPEADSGSHSDTRHGKRSTRAAAEDKTEGAAAHPRMSGSRKKSRSTLSRSSSKSNNELPDNPAIRSRSSRSRHGKHSEPDPRTADTDNPSSNSADPRKGDD